MMMMMMIIIMMIIIIIMIIMLMMIIIMMMLMMRNVAAKRYSSLSRFYVAILLSPEGGTLMQSPPGAPAHLCRSLLACPHTYAELSELQISGFQSFCKKLGSVVLKCAKVSFSNTARGAAAASAAVIFFVFATADLTIFPSSLLWMSLRMAPPLSGGELF